MNLPSFNRYPNRFRDTINAMIDEASKDRGVAGGLSQLESSAGRMMRIDRQEWRIGKITSGAGPTYAFQEVHHTDSGWVDGALTGTALEINGKTGLPVGTRLMLQPSRHGPRWLFDFDGDFTSGPCLTRLCVSVNPGSPLAGVTVTVKNMAGTITYGTGTTDSSGRACVDVPSGGQYWVRACRTWDDGGEGPPAAAWLGFTGQGSVLAGTATLTEGPYQAAGDLKAKSTLSGSGSLTEYAEALLANRSTLSGIASLLLSGGPFTHDASVTMGSVVSLLADGNVSWEGEEGPNLFGAASCHVTCSMSGTADDSGLNGSAALSCVVTLSATGSLLIRAQTTISSRATLAGEAVVPERVDTKCKATLWGNATVLYIDDPVDPENPGGGEQPEEP